MDKKYHIGDIVKFKCGNDKCIGKIIEYSPCYGYSSIQIDIIKTKCYTSFIHEDGTCFFDPEDNKILPLTKSDKVAIFKYLFLGVKKHG